MTLYTVKHLEKTEETDEGDWAQCTLCGDLVGEADEVDEMVLHAINKHSASRGFKLQDLIEVRRQ